MLKMDKDLPRLCLPCTVRPDFFRKFNEVKIIVIGQVSITYKLKKFCKMQNLVWQDHF